MVTTRNASRAQPTGLQATSLVACDVGRHLAKEVAAGRTGSNSAMPEHMGTWWSLSIKVGFCYLQCFCKFHGGNDHTVSHSIVF